MLDHLKSFCAALATRGPVRLRVEVNAEAWRTLRAEFHRPYKHEPNAGFTLYLDGDAGTVEFVAAGSADAEAAAVDTLLAGFESYQPPTEGDA